MRPKKIVLFENGALDAILIQESLHQKGVLCNIHLLKEDKEIGMFLEHLPLNLIQETPDLIMINEELINWKGVNIINNIRNSAYQIPIIVLTSIVKGHRSHENNQVNCYIHKPLEIKEFIKVIQELKQIWLSLVK